MKKVSSFYWAVFSVLTALTYLFSGVVDLKPTTGLYLKNSAHLSNV